MELLKKLTDINSPSGNEEKIREFILNEIKEYADEYSVDSLGNIIVHKAGKGEKLVLSAHMDEVGFLSMITDANGFIRPRKIGNVNVLSLHNSRVVFNNGAVGTINCKNTKTIENTAKITDFYIDVIDKCKVKEITPYDTATFVSDFYENDDYVCTKALSSRSGCEILINLIKEIKNSPLDLYFIFAVQGEIGFHCVKTAVTLVKPDYAININSIKCDDVPDEKNEIKLGYGPVIKIVDKNIICHPVIKKLLVNKAKAENIGIQYAVSTDCGSDAGSMSVVGTGVITGEILIPCRNLHSANEIISKKDYKKTYKILKKICEEGI